MKNLRKTRLRAISAARRPRVKPRAGVAAAPSFALVSHPRRDPGISAVLSLIVPGVGQIYNGAFLRGIFWLIITPGFWIGSGGTLGWVCHLIAA